jgi:hypothetical protein
MRLAVALKPSGLSNHLKRLNRQVAKNAKLGIRERYQSLNLALLESWRFNLLLDKNDVTDY